MLTDRGSCFTADAFEHACKRHGVQHRMTKPYTPRTNGMVERFNGRVQREVLGITLWSHQDLETLLAGFNVAYNGRRQRVLKGRSPDMVLRERLKAKPELAKPVTKPPDPDALPKALKVVARAKEVSHPDTAEKGVCGWYAGSRRSGRLRCRGIIPRAQASQDQLRPASRGPARILLSPITPSRTAACKARSVAVAS